jgi:hypothetical protein
MSSSRSRLLTALVAAVLITSAASLATVQAQDQKPADQGQKQPPTPPADASKEEKKKVDEFAEAAQAIAGPAGNPECVWLGWRVVDRLYRDDLDTAFRHLDLYDRFGCPGAHIQASFRCLVRQGYIDQKSPETLNARVHACWINPNLPPATAAAPPAAATTGAAAPSGTSNQ